MLSIVESLVYQHGQVLCQGSNYNLDRGGPDEVGQSTAAVADYVMS